MRALLAMAAGLCLLAAPMWARVPDSPEGANGAQEAIKPQPPRPCKGESAAECGVSEQDFKKAHELFARGLKLKKKAPEQALSAFEEASNLVPREVEYTMTREILRQQLVYKHIQQGDKLSWQQHTADSIAEFRKALELDPANQTAWQRLHEVSSGLAPPTPTYIESEPGEQDFTLHAKAGQQPVHATGNAQSAYTQVGAAFGIKISFDESTPSRSVRLDLDRATFEQAMNALSLLTHTFWTPVSPDEILVAADNPSKHKELERWLLRTFYLPETSTPQELNDIVNLLRNLFGLRFVTVAPAASTITVRGPAPVIRAATQLLKTLWAGKPQVMLDFEVYEVNRQMLETLGLSLPLQFNVFNIPAVAIAALGNINIQQLISQLSTGATTLSALLAQLQQQYPFLQQPFATFGGGLTLMGITAPPLTANFSKNESRILTLDKTSMRAAQGNAATFRLGERYPVLNASFAPFVSIPGLAGPPGSLATFPSFTYEDLGLTIKAKPAIHGASDVTLDLEMQLRALGTQAFNGVPVITNRSYKGVISVKNDEPAVVAGAMSRTEQDTVQGMPGVGFLPVLGNLASNKTKERDEDEILILITPHILSSAPSTSAPAIVVPSGE